MEKGKYFMASVEMMVGNDCKRLRDERLRG